MQKKKKPSDKSQPPFLIKTVSSLGIEENFLNLIKRIYEISIGNSILTGKRLNALFLRLGTRQGNLMSPLLFNVILEFQCNKARKRDKRHSNRNRSKAIFILDNMIIYVESVMEFTKKLLEQMTEFLNISSKQ